MLNILHSLLFQVPNNIYCVTNIKKKNAVKTIKALLSRDIGQFASLILILLVYTFFIEEKFLFYLGKMTLSASQDYFPYCPRHSYS